jgi:hypothetical protein
MAAFSVRRRKFLGDSSRWNDPVFARCLDRVLELFAERGWLRIYAVHVRGELAAALLGFAYRGTFFAYQIAESEQHAELGLGHCAASHAIRSCIEEGLERFEFLGEAQPWKRSYFSGLTPAATVTLGLDNSAYWSNLAWNSLRLALSRRFKEARSDS